MRLLRESIKQHLPWGALQGALIHWRYESCLMNDRRAASKKYNFIPSALRKFVDKWLHPKRRKDTRFAASMGRARDKNPKLFAHYSAVLELHRTLEPGFRMKQTIDIITTFEPFAHFSDPFGLANTKNPHGLLTFRTRSD